MNKSKQALKCHEGNCISCRLYTQSQFSWSHQDCVITTMHALINFKGTTVTSKIVKQKKKIQEIPKHSRKVKSCQNKKATDVTDFPYTFGHRINLCPTAEAFCGVLSAYREPVLGASFFYCASLSVEPNEAYLIPLSSHCPPAFKVSRRLHTSRQHLKLARSSSPYPQGHAHKALAVPPLHSLCPFTMYTSLMGTVSPYVF